MSKPEGVGSRDRYQWIRLNFVHLLSCLDPDDVTYDRRYRANLSKKQLRKVFFNDFSTTRRTWESGHPPLDPSRARGSDGHGTHLWFLLVIEKNGKTTYFWSFLDSNLSIFATRQYCDPKSDFSESKLTNELTFKISKKSGHQRQRYRIILVKFNKNALKIQNSK